ANRDRSDDDPKYPWLTGRTKKRPHGPQPNLPNGELPLTVAYPSQLNPAKAGQVGLCEGLGVKPRLAAERLGIPVIGASGGNFAASAKTLQTYLKELSADNCLLLPDAGAISNSNVLHQYTHLRGLLVKWSYSLAIAWWGQTQKSAPDIDELEPADYQNIQHISWEEFLGHKQQKPQAKNPKPSEISREEWELKFKLPQQLLDIGEFVKKAYQRLIAKGFGKQQEPVSPDAKIKAEPLPIIYTPEPEKPTSTAIVLLSQWQQWQLKPAVIPYEPGNLPSKEEWQGLGCPTLVYEGGDRLLTYKEIYQKWDKSIVQETSDVGQGKSHAAGLLKSDWLTDGKGKIYYNDINHRNPSTLTVERNFADQASRNDGLKYDKTRKTASGFDHVVRPKAGETPDIPGNCPETQTFLLLNQDKNYIARSGKDSPICWMCPLQNGCEYISDRTDTLKYKTEIRQHLDQSINGKADDVCIVEEAGASLKPYKENRATKHDLAFAYQELKQKDAVLAMVIEPIFDALYKLMDVEELPEHGWDFLEIQKHLPSIDELNLRLLDGYEGTQDIWDIPTITELSTAVNKALFPSLRNLLNASQSPKEKQAIIRDNVPFNWISLVLDAMQDKAYLRIDKTGLHITKHNNRHRSIIDSFKMSILMDATITRTDLARKLRIKKSDIIEIRQTRPTYSNQTFYLIKDMGSGSKKRRQDDSKYSLQNRIQKLTAHIESLHPDGKTGLIDHQGFHSRSGEIALSGYWGLHNRGSNEFKECEALVLIGTPYSNLGQCAAEYYIETSEVVKPCNLSGKYGAWVNNKVKAEVYQGAGRLRAHLRPHQQLTTYIVANKVVTAADLRERFPGCTVKEVDVIDFCPEAAPKGTQRQQGLMRALCKALKVNHDATTSDIARSMGISRGRVSQIAIEILQMLGRKGGFEELKSLLVLFIESFNTKLTAPDNLPEDERWIAQTLLPLIVEQYPEEPIEVVKEVLNVASAFGHRTFKRILSAAASDVVEKLLDCLLKVLLPKQLWTVEWLNL
ncbi:MAG TPA: hypothetical protein V6D16_08750, partial [Candidatus Obscuribacterales bacterium]